MKVDYDERQYAVYAEGRALPPHTISTWMRVFAQHAGHDGPQDVVDLGSGTGRFSPALADTFGGQVLGVEPSQRMRAVADRRPPILACATRPEPRLASHCRTTAVTWW